MPKKKLYPKKKTRLRKIKRYHIQNKITPTKTFVIASHAFRLLLLIILVYIVTSTLIMFFTESFSFLKQVVTLSIGGFFGFFMGYFGWIFADKLAKWLSGKEEEKSLENFRFQL